MGFREHCEGLGITLRPEDFELIRWKLRMIPERLHKQILEKYITVYLEELEKCNPNNYARHGIARHYANRFLKLYKVSGNE